MVFPGGHPSKLTSGMAVDTAHFLERKRNEKKRGPNTPEILL
jgi:hypothetical protein